MQASHYEHDVRRLRVGKVGYCQASQSERDVKQEGRVSASMRSSVAHMKLVLRNVQDCKVIASMGFHMVQVM